MNRFTFLKNLLGASVLPAVVLAHPSAMTPTTDASRVRRELLDAWAASERMTLITAGQMPAHLFGFRYTLDAMSFAEQWRHCCTFTTAQIAARLNVKDPYATQPLPAVMTKQEVLDGLKGLYSFIRQVIGTTDDAALFSLIDYAGEPMSAWRLMSVMENHIIHHRGQCMVYLRLNGITPEGYIGW